MKLLIIYNPQAGGGRAARLLGLIKQYLESLEVSATFLMTQYRSHAIDLAKNADLNGYDGLIASGGDGTLFEVLNGYILNASQDKPPLGLIPNGTGNAFMKDLGLQKHDWRRAIDTVLQQQPKSLDIGKLQSQGQTLYFINIVGMGFVAEVAQAAIPFKWMGNAAYTLATLLKMISLKAQDITLELDGKIIQRQGVFVEVANSRFTGTSFLMAPKAKLDDGLLDVIVLNSISRLRLLRLFSSVYDGTHIDYPEVEYFQAKSIKVTEAQPTQLIPDGEILGKTPAEFNCLHQAIEFFWPKD